MGFLRHQKAALQIGRTVESIAGPRRRDQRRVRHIAAAIPLKRHIAPDRWLNVPVVLPDGRQTSFAINDLSELLVLHAVLVEGQYAKPELAAPRVIVDAGSNIGASVAYFATRYPTATVIAVEPSPGTFARLSANTRQFTNVVVYQLAVGDRNAWVDFYDQRGGSWASSLTPRADAQATRVRMMTIDAIMELAGVSHVDLLKLDIEGAEYAALKALQPEPRTIAAIVGEIHTFLPATNFTEHDILDLLTGYSVAAREAGGDRIFIATSSATHAERP